MAKKSGNNGIVYSTDPDDYLDSSNHEEQTTLPPSQQTLYLRRSTKGRGGKSAIVINGFVGKSMDLEILSKLLKNKCGVGGTAKDGEIIMQGEILEKVAEILKKEGYKVKGG